jgi:hypothetical protein
MVAVVYFSRAGTVEFESELLILRCCWPLGLKWEDEMGRVHESTGYNSNWTIPEESVMTLLYTILPRGGASELNMLDQQKDV